MKNIYLLLSFLLITNSISAQTTADHVSGDLLVRLYNNADLSQVIKSLGVVDGQTTRLRVKRQLSESLAIWQLEYDETQLPEERMLEICRAQPGIQAAQFNRILEQRVVPNDPDYGLQWQYDNPGGGGALADADIDADSAWDVTTGGVTAIGDDVVVCVIDNGLDLTHQDINPNRWYNTNEIPNNGLDDDNNGYVDDYDGWNAYDNNGDISGGGFVNGHGTSVAGIVGAKGNNGIGVTGVNWDVQIMFVVGGGNEADAIAAYDYPYTMRRLYNQTNGQQGAFVVVTNASWGVDQVLASNFPILCAFYDSLGAEGVLNVAATTNSNRDVDVTGDLPTHCGSDYLVAVTNTNDADQKLVNAGYGDVSIDLGAPGEGAYTTTMPNSYGTFGGTSGASPHVAGAVALLYASPCTRLAYEARSQPAATALLLKNLILQGVDTLSQLDTFTVSKGRLNLNNSMQLTLQSGCTLTGCYAPYGLASSAVTGNSMMLSWVGVPAAQMGYLLRYREQGNSNWIDTITTDTFFQLSNLQACTYYEVQVASDCDTSIGAYSGVFLAKTGDCCDAPMMVNIDSTGVDFVQLSWNNNPLAQSYTLEYRLAGDTSWQADTVTASSYNLMGLDTCADYELRIQSTCVVNVNNNYSPTLTFKTKGCGACEDLSYCAAAGGDASFEWISQVVVGTGINNTSGSDGGYAAFTGSSPVFYREHGYSMELTFDKTSISTPSWAWKIWIDFNQDGQFDDQTELAYASAPITTSQTFTTNAVLYLPATVKLGNTRMRVAFKWGNSSATPCGTFSYGEVEDYCITVEEDPTAIENFEHSDLELFVYPNPVVTQAQVQINTRQSQEAVLRVLDVRGVELYQRQLSLAENSREIYTWNVSGWPSGVYLLQLTMEDGRQIVKKIQK